MSQVGLGQSLSTKLIQKNIENSTGFGFYWNHLPSRRGALIATWLILPLALTEPLASLIFHDISAKSQNNERGSQESDEFNHIVYPHIHPPIVSGCLMAYREAS